MHREITDGIYCIEELGPHKEQIVEELDEDQDWHLPGETVHNPQNAYLICADKTLIFDTTSPANTDTVLEDIEEILDGRGLDYVVVSHPDIPHAGNAHPILEQYPDAELITPSFGDLHEIYHLGEATQVDVGDRLDLGGREVTFTEAPVLDAAMSHWMLETTTGTLFSADWMCFPVMASESLTFVDEIESEVTVQRMVEFNARTIFWLQYVDPEVMIAEIEQYIESYDIQAIAPTHGLVIREDADQYLEMYSDVVEHVVEQGRAETI